MVQVPGLVVRFTALADARRYAAVLERIGGLKLEREHLRGSLFLAIVVASALLQACAPSLATVREHFDSYDAFLLRLERLRVAHPDVVSFEPIGTSHEGRSIVAVRVAGPLVDPASAPALLALFGEHGDEHDSIDLGLGLITHLATGYGSDPTITSLLDRKVVWMVPMMNPDGAEFDRSGTVEPFSWRKNRRPTSETSWGVDLNRNWEPRWGWKPESDANDPDSGWFAGERPFSERETQAVRDFLLAHREVRIFLDYHTGFAPFMQGGVGFPIPKAEADLPPTRRARLETLAAGVAAAVTNPRDDRHAFVVPDSPDAAKTIRPLAPWWARPFIPESIPPAPGTSGEWVYGELGTAVIGFEISRDWSYFRGLPSSQSELVENQSRGLLFLLEELSSDTFHEH